MSSVDHQHLYELFREACELEPDEQAHFIHQHCADAPELRHELERLLAEDRAGSDLPLPAVDVGLLADDSTSVKHPDRIGNYEILSVLGEGGMGVVYRALQDTPGRVVALKVIRPGMVTPTFLRRFELETEVLGRLSHPGIAGIYDAGTFESAHGPAPYFAMELVDGQPLLRFAREHDLTIPQRLTILQRLCEAAHHAHQRGVIHRDLKPTNVLIEQHPGSLSRRDDGFGKPGGLEARPTEQARATGLVGQPKILDFGVARLTDTQLTTVHTHLGQLIGTLEYMSPEQIAGDSRQVDLRADVYALGVIGYELLTDTLPFDLRGKSIAETARIIQHDQPHRLSAINRLFRGDLETIISTAIERDPARRYESAAALGEDIRRYLNDEPISARPPTTIYQLQKFARRHQGLVTGVVLAFGLLIVGIIATSVQAVRATRAEQTQAQLRLDAEDAEQEAKTQAAIAEEVNTFLNDDLLAAVTPSPQAGRGRDVLMRDVLDAASERIETASAGRFADQPLVEAAIRRTLCTVYRKLGEYTLAGPHARRALALRQKHLGENHPETLDVLTDLAVLIHDQGRLDEAETLHREVIQRRWAVLGNDHPDTFTAINNLATLLMDKGELQEAERFTRQALQGRRRVLGSTHSDTLNSLNNLGYICHDLGKFEEAEQAYRQARQGREITFGREHPQTLITTMNLAGLLRSIGRLDEAEPLYREALQGNQRVLGEDHPDTIRALNNLGLLMSDRGDYQAAKEFDRDALQRSRRVLGHDHPDTLTTLSNLGVVLFRLGELEEATTCLNEVLTRRRATLGEEHPDTLVAMNNAAFIQSKAGKLDHAEATHRKILAIRQRTLGDNHPDVLVTHYNLALVLKDQKRHADAEAHFHEAITRGRTVLPADHWRLGVYLAGLGELLREQGRFFQAEARLLEAVDILTASRGPTHTRTISAMQELVALYETWEQSDPNADYAAERNKWRKRIEDAGANNQ